MASTQVPCDMCSDEQAVGYCNACGNIGESCQRIHKTGRAFKTHIIKMFGKAGDTPSSIIFDITEQMCQHHPTERAYLFCKKHGLMICGRCLHSDHLSCGHDVVDLCHEAKHIDYERTNAMTAALSDLKGTIKCMKEEVGRQNVTSKTNAAKCDKELDNLETRLKRNVVDSISGFRQDAHKFNDKNTDAYECVSSVCKENLLRVEKEESQIDECINNSFTGYLYVISRNFDKGISEVKRQIKETENKHTFKQYCLRENKIASKCLIEDLRDICELQEEVDGSDDLTTSSIGTASQETQMTRKEMCDELKHVKQDLDSSEKKRKDLCDELKQVKEELDSSEKKRNDLFDELKQVKEDLDSSEKKRKDLCDELKQVDSSEKARKELCDELKRVKQDLDSSESAELVDQCFEQQTGMIMEMYHTQMNVAKYLELGMLKLCNHPKIAKDVHVSATTTKMLHHDTITLMTKIKTTSQLVVTEIIPSIRTGIEKQDEANIKSSFKMIEAFVVDLQTETNTIRERYNKISLEGSSIIDDIEMVLRYKRNEKTKRELEREISVQRMVVDVNDHTTAMKVIEEVRKEARAAIACLEAYLHLGMVQSLLDKISGCFEGMLSVIYSQNAITGVADLLLLTMRFDQSDIRETVAEIKQFWVMFGTVCQGYVCAFQKEIGSLYAYLEKPLESMSQTEGLK